MKNKILSLINKKATFPLKIKIMKKLYNIVMEVQKM